MRTTNIIDKWCLKYKVCILSFHQNANEYIHDWIHRELNYDTTKYIDVNQVRKKQKKILGEQ